MMNFDSTEVRRKHVEKKLSYMGLSLRAWAQLNGFNPSMVRSVVVGKVSCRFGVSHKIAVLLGLKEGEFSSPDELKADVKEDGVPV